MPGPGAPWFSSPHTGRMGSRRSRAHSASPSRSPSRVPRNTSGADIEEHRHRDGGFDADLLELQNAFLVGFLARFLCEVHCPLVTLRNPRPQDDDIPHELIIQNRLPGSS